MPDHKRGADDPLSPSRGLVLGVMISLAMWVVILVGLVALLTYVL